MRKYVVSLCMLIAIGLTAREAEAQMAFGAHASWASETDFGLGARAGFELPSVENLSIVPSFDIFFPSSPLSGVDVGWMELNGNVHYAFPLENNASILPYAGGGLSIVRASVEGDFPVGRVKESDTEMGLNLLGGLQFRSFGAMRPFAELRYNTVGQGQLVISGGITF